MSAPSGGIELNVFVSLSDDRNLQNDPNPFPGVTFRNLQQSGRKATLTVSHDSVPALASQPHVTFMSLGESLTYPLVSIGEGSSSAVEPFTNVNREKLHKGRKKVLVGIVDVGGFDFAHEDFRTGNRTSFVRIWDQGQEDGLSLIHI